MVLVSREERHAQHAVDARRQRIIAVRQQERTAAAKTRNRCQAARRAGLCSLQRKLQAEQAAVEAERESVLQRQLEEAMQAVGRAHRDARRFAQTTAEWQSRQHTIEDARRRQQQHRYKLALRQAEEHVRSLTRRLDTFRANAAIVKAREDARSARRVAQQKQAVAAEAAAAKRAKPRDAWVPEGYRQVLPPDAFAGTHYHHRPAAVEIYKHVAETPGGTGAGHRPGAEDAFAAARAVARAKAAADRWGLEQAQRRKEQAKERGNAAQRVAQVDAAHSDITKALRSLQAKERRRKLARTHAEAWGATALPRPISDAGLEAAFERNFVFETKPFYVAANTADAAAAPTAIETAPKAQSGTEGGEIHAKATPAPLPEPEPEDLRVIARSADVPSSSPTKLHRWAGSAPRAVGSGDTSTDAVSATSPDLSIPDPAAESSSLLADLALDEETLEETRAAVQRQRRAEAEPPAPRHSVAFAPVPPPLPPTPPSDTLDSDDDDDDDENDGGDADRGTDPASSSDAGAVIPPPPPLLSYRLECSSGESLSAASELFDLSRLTSHSLSDES